MSARWSRREVSILRRAYEDEGMDRAEVAALLPGRSTAAVINKIGEMKLEKGCNKKPELTEKQE